MNKTQIKKSFKKYQKPDLSSIDNIKSKGFRFESVPFVISDIDEIPEPYRLSQILDSDLSLEAGWIAVKIDEPYDGYSYVYIGIDEIQEEIIKFIETDLQCEDGDDKINHYVIEECSDIIINMFL